MPDIDPAWLYSSVSQSSAAVVGLMGGIFGGRIIDHVGLMRSERRPVSEQVDRAWRTIVARSQGWTEVEAKLTEEIHLCQEVLSHGGIFCMIDGPWQWLTPSQSKTKVRAEAHLRRQEAALQVVAGQLRECYRHFTGSVNVDDIEERALQLLRTADRLPEFVPGRVSDQMRQDADVLLNLKARVTRFQRKLVPGEFMLVIGALAWIAAFGVLLPLVALPGLNSILYPKWLILLGLGGGVTVLLAYFVYQVWQLLGLGRFRWEELSGERS